MKEPGWQRLFLWGWVPGTNEIEAEKLCGSTGKIQSIRTRLTFAEGLGGALPGYYVNIYSPDNGAVHCQARL